MNSTRKLPMFLLLGMFLIMVMASGCEGEVDEQPAITPTQEETTEVLPIVESTEIPPREQGTNIPPITEGPFYEECPQPTETLVASGNASNGYVDRQIVFTGDPVFIEEVVNAKSSLFESTSPNKEFELPFVDEFDNNLVIHLYELQVESVWAAVEEINDYILKEPIPNVFAEPNYVISLPVFGRTSGNPCPGCSGGISGDPMGQLTSILEYGNREFLNQWAFNGSDGSDGDIDLYDQNYTWTAKDGDGIDCTGNNTEVAVFDTVPLDFSPGHKYIDWASIHFHLCVWKPGLMIESDNSSETSITTDNIAMQDHGLFVTGLAQGVAPGARFILIEALNADAQGDVISLLFGMNEYVKIRRQNNNNLQNTVINLSLGLDPDSVPPNADACAQVFLEMIKEVLGEDWVHFDELRGRPFPSVALNLALTAYEEEGAVIVASAGNDFGQLAQTPAGFLNVLGVSSSNIDSGLSYFSNYGDVAAPGGSSEDKSEDPDISSSCGEYLAEGFIGDCPYAVVSIISNNPADPTPSSPGFGYWAGTSMSAPMVSGLAALVLDKCPGITPADVRQMILTQASPSNVNGLGAGVINVCETLAQECPPTPTPTPTP